MLPFFVFVVAARLMMCPRCSRAFTSSITPTFVADGPGMIARRPRSGCHLLFGRDSQHHNDDDDDDDVPRLRRREVRRRVFVVRSSIVTAMAGITIATPPPALDLSSAALADDDDNIIATFIDPSTRLPEITHRAYLDVEFGAGERGGGKGGRRLVIAWLVTSVSVQYFSGYRLAAFAGILNVPPSFLVR